MPRVLDEAPAAVGREVKPRLRGWLHTAMAPLALAAGIVLVALAPTSRGVVGGAVFLAASVLALAIAPAAGATRLGGTFAAGGRTA